MNSNPTYKPRDSEQNPEAACRESSGALVRRPRNNYQSSRRSLRHDIQATTSQPDKPAFLLNMQSPQATADQFLSHFIAFFARVSHRQVLFNSWLVALPDMLTARSSVIRHSIIAASMIYAGKNSGNTSAVVESYKWYGAGIEKQRKLLQELQRQKRVPTVEEICNPILLSFFEITCNTSATGYFQHLIGAARLLEMRGPEACSSGILQQVFLTLRIQLV